MFVAMQKEGSGYQLYDLGSNKWMLRSPKGAYTGSYFEVKSYAVHIGFDPFEIEIGKEEMEKHFNNAAEYGIFKKFMWSFDKEEVYAKVSGNH